MKLSFVLVRMCNPSEEVHGNVQGLRAHSEGIESYFKPGEDLDGRLPEKPNT